MEIATNAYFSPSLIKKKARIIKRIHKHKPMLSLYCITLPTNPANWLDIYDYKELLQPHYKKTGIPLILGLAPSKADAFLLLQTMVDDMVKEDNLDLSTFFKLEQRFVKGVAH